MGIGHLEMTSGAPIVLKLSRNNVAQLQSFHLQLNSLKLRSAQKYNVSSIEKGCPHQVQVQVLELKPYLSL
jgi:hypothetical protein